ncbi:GT-D fold domain-containing glycosyltransferase [Paenibacillus sp. R14(2021)]|uniref:GT-D fold domain-containing glycosyltransferase n=1 Tax=Paenibacillus sp. R14(2021) TaxID=2859228 RepID=UPI001C6112E8|nr:GT-D fold domain-containing glycosyltransferase [Paenibacillus sp. R14(2021)]
MAKNLSTTQVLRQLDNALKRKRPLSLVRIGDGENIVLAQKSVWSFRKVMREPWAAMAKKGRKGIPFPNLEIRDEIVRSIRNATIVGILPKNDRMIRAPRYLKRNLTNQTFRYFNLKPKRTCHACINRIAVRKPKFRKMLRGKRILVINRNPFHIKSLLKKKPYRLRVTATIPFSNYSQINSTLRRVRKLKRKFDIALISCGVNAVILAPKIAAATGKVAVDFGKAPMKM